MKRFTSVALLLAMIIALFAGCGNAATPAETGTNPAETVAAAPDTNLADAVEYVKTIYKDAGEMTAADFQRIGSVPMGTAKYEVVWTADVAEDLVKIVKGADGLVTIDVNEETKEEIKYVLTATLTGTDGTTASLSWNHVIPAALGDDMGAIVDLAYQLEDGQSLPNPATLTGVISAINTPWSEDYKNITVTILVEGREDKPIMCYRLAGEGAKDLKPGDVITVTGSMKNYKGTIEFDQGCALDAVTEGDGAVPDAPTDPAEIVDAAFKLEPGQALPYTATLTGKVVWINSGWSEKYQNITVTISTEGQRIQCFRMKGDKAKDVFLNDVITVTGTLKNYNGTIEFDAGCQLVEILEDNASPTAPKDPVDMVNIAYKMKEGELTPYSTSLTGTVVSVDTPWSDKYGNITVTMVVAGVEDKPIMCYRLSGEGAKDLAIGDVITVYGELKNYKGTIEFNTGCKLIKVVKGEAPAVKVPDTLAEQLKEASELKTGALPYVSTITGVITEIESYNETYKSYYLYVSDGENEVYCYSLPEVNGAELDVGDTVKVEGPLTAYKGVPQFSYKQNSTITLIAKGETAEPEVPETTAPTEPEVPETTAPTEPEIPETTAPTEPEVPETTAPTEPEVPETTAPTEPEVPETTAPTEPELSNKSSIPEIIEALKNGKEIDFLYTITGEVSKAYDPKGGKRNAVVSVGGQTVNCNNIADNGADWAAMTSGDTVTITGEPYLNSSGKFCLGTCTLVSRTPAPTVEEPAEGPLTCAAANELSNKAYPGYKSKNTYSITGTVTAVNTKYGNITITDGTGSFTTYGIDGWKTIAEADRPVVGDTVTITGKVENYNGTPQMYYPSLVIDARG